MTKYIIRRTIGLLPLLVGIVALSFLLMKQAPGGPQAAFQGNKRISQEQIDAWLKRWCLSRNSDVTSIFTEFGGWFGILNCEKSGSDAFFSDQGNLNVLPSFMGGGTNGVIHGDLGFGIQSGRPVTDMIFERMPATLILTSVSLLLWVGLAILLGVYAAVHRYSVFDQAITFFSYVFYSLPTFWFGLILIFFFADAMHLLPTGGIITTRNWSPFNTPQYWDQFAKKPLDAIFDIGWHLILPVATLVAVSIAGDSRFVRAAMLESLGQDYVRTAKAKGLPSRLVVGKHALRNAMLPVVTNVALEIPFLFSGAIVTETIFTLDGMGFYFINALQASDPYPVMAWLMVVATMVIVFNLIADILYGVFDPRIRYD